MCGKMVLENQLQLWILDFENAKFYFETFWTLP